MLIFPGGEDKELTETRTGAAPWWTPVNWHATSKRAHMVVDVANHDMEGVAKGSGLASAVATIARGTLGDGVAVCRTRRFVSFGLIGRFYT